MRSRNNYNTETSKVFKRLGQLVNITANRKSQRGIIARKALTILENYELEQFRAKLPKFELRTIKVQGGGETYYI